MKRLPIVYGAFLLSVIAQDGAQHLVSDLYVEPQPITIAGYSGSAMEPFISPDGRYLFFNNSNDPGVNTNLQFAERTGKLTFRYLGELPGVNSAVLDAVPDRTGLHAGRCRSGEDQRMAEGARCLRAP